MPLFHNDPLQVSSGNIIELEKISSDYRVNKGKEFLSGIMFISAPTTGCDNQRDADYSAWQPKQCGVPFGCITTMAWLGRGCAISLDKRRRLTLARNWTAGNQNQIIWSKLWAVNKVILKISKRRGPLGQWLEKWMTETVITRTADAHYFQKWWLEGLNVWLTVTPIRESIIRNNFGMDETMAYDLVLYDKGIDLGNGGNLCDLDGAVDAALSGVYGPYTTHMWLTLEIV